MTWLKIVLLLLVLLQPSWTQNFPPFTWEALEEAESHVSTATASPTAESARTRQTARESVLLMETPAEHSCGQDTEPRTLCKAVLKVVIRLLSLLTIPAAFLLGWIGRSKQAVSSQALQQAKVANQGAVGAHDIVEKTHVEGQDPAQVDYACLAVQSF